MPKFQARHYRALAEVIADMRDEARETGDLLTTVAADALTKRSIKLFARDNPRFRESTFRAAAA